MKYDFRRLTPAVLTSLGLIFLALLFGLNALSTRAYGESEFWFSLIKVATVVIFLVLGVLMIVGILGGSSPGFHNWTDGEAPFVGGGAGILAIFMVAGFSFQGTELVGVAGDDDLADIGRVQQFAGDGT